MSIDGALYLLTARGGTEPLFRDPQDYDTYLSLVAEHKTRYGFRLFAYCLLPEEIWLCLEPRPGTTVSAIMHDLTAAYTRSVNKRHARSGPLVHERFKETIVEKPPYLLSLTAYVHSLPLQAGLVQERGGYPFSSCRRYCDRGGNPGASTDRLDMDAELREVLSLLPAAIYEEYLNSFSTEDLERLARTFQQRIVGSEAFVGAVKAKRMHRAHPNTAEATQSPQPPAPSLGSVGTRAVSSQPRQLALVIASALAVMFSGGVVASLHRRISGLQETIAALSEENEESFRTRASLAIQRADSSDIADLDGTGWEIRVVPMGGQRLDAVQQDSLVFGGHQVASQMLRQEGFPTSNYTITREPNGTLLWGTIQTHSTGEVVCWRGEWQGQRMQGIVTRQSPGKTPENFTFVGVSRSPSAASRSET